MARQIPPSGFKGRGALANPANRFDSHHTEDLDDGWYQEEPASSIETELLVDSSRSVIARNDSPDIPYEQSINPYRGCEHGCVFCLSGDTPILMGDGTTRALERLKVGDEIYGTIREGNYRRYTRTRVLAHWSVIKPVWRIALEDGSTLLAGADHRFLTERGWKFVSGSEQGVNRRPHLKAGCRLMGARKRDIEGQCVKSTARLGVTSVAPTGKVMRLYDITTGTEDFIANGVVSHNCYARPSHAYLGMSPGLDFETRLVYKPQAAQLLRDELARPGYACRNIMLGSNTDPYQPVERKLGITRSILELLAETRHPVAITTRSSLLLRDLDLLKPMAEHGLAMVMYSITTLDSTLKRKLEPRSAAAEARLHAISALRAAGVPVGVLAAPMIPAVNDSELESILERSWEAGARHAGYVLLRLPLELKDIFREWLAVHMPDRAEHVMSLIKETREGKEYSSRFGARMRGTGVWAQLLRDRFRLASRRLGFTTERKIELATHLFRPPSAGGQMGMDF